MNTILPKNHFEIYVLKLFQVLARGKNKSPGIRYEYTLSSNGTKPPKYYWKLGDWSACSATCGGGIQRRLPMCFEEIKGAVDEEFCWTNVDENRPSEKNRICNEDPCPAHWWIGPWQLCPVTCKQSGNDLKQKFMKLKTEKNIFVIFSFFHFQNNQFH